MKAPFRSIALLAAGAALTLSACADPQAVGDIKASVERLEAQQKDIVTKLEGLEKSNKEILAKAGTASGQARQCARSEQEVRHQDRQRRRRRAQATRR